MVIWNTPGEMCFAKHEHFLSSDPYASDGKLAGKSNSERIDPQNFEGIVVDNLRKPIAYASVRITMGDSTLSTLVCDDQGRFRFKVNAELQRLSIEVSSLGYITQRVALRTMTPGFEVVLEKDNTILETVHVQTAKPQYVRLVDRMVVNIDGTLLGTGLSSLELLQRTPSLWVDAGGNITMRGSQSVVVMIGDVVLRMSSFELSEYLRSIPSEDINKIEVIANPGAEYEAEGTGGIVRIILKKGVNEGYKIILASRYKQQGKDPFYNGGSMFDYNRGKFKASGALGYKIDKQRHVANYHNFYADASEYRSDTRRFKENTGYNARITTSYEFNDRQSLGLQSVLLTSHSDQKFYTDNEHRQENDTIFKKTENNWINKGTMSNTTLNYTLVLDTLSSTFKLLADHLYNDNEESNDYQLRALSSAGVQQYQNLSPSTTNIYSFQTDLDKRYLSGSKFAVGMKYVGTRRNNTVIRNNYLDNQWEQDAAYSNNFVYHEDLLMGYASFNRNIKDFSVKAGIRAEQTFIDGRSTTSLEKVNQQYLNFFPSIYLTQAWRGTGSTIHLNYGKRIRRPSFKDINPYTLQIDDFVVLQGNALLQPEFIHKVEAGLSFKKGVVVDLFYSDTQNSIVQSVKAMDSKLLKYQPINFNSKQDYGITAFVPQRINKQWSIQGNFSFFNSEYIHKDMKQSQPVFEGRLNHILKFNNLFDTTCAFSYRTLSYRGNTQYADQFYTDVVLSRPFFKGKGRIVFQVDDIFNTQREREFTATEGTVINFYQKRPTRTFNVSFTYMISRGKKSEEKKIQQSNEDERQRVN
ncbi:hypothetical protein M472_07995 [Sphingobacterium paucimobilis HER1398]|uniref:Outer membrane protein beta-barrel domain-containing protein n=2 Tax=Sphingobacterium TaxID=28453 RepID=U2HT83_9SPHI|nr:hypothetical protein M472_07995 [Sphingobacterium paucimobilis HER1398]